MKSAIIKYEILLTLGNWNTISPEQEQIVDLTTVAEKFKDNNLNIPKSVNTSPKKKKGKTNQSQ